MRYPTIKRSALLVLGSIVGMLAGGCANSPHSTTATNPPRVAVLPGDEPTLGAKPEALKPAPMACGSRSTGVIDYVASATGEPDLQSAFDGYAEKGETAVIIKHRDDNAVARYVDADGVTQAQVVARQSGAGWLIDTVERCA